MNSKICKGFPFTLGAIYQPEQNPLPQEMVLDIDQNLLMDTFKTPEEALGACKQVKTDNNLEKACCQLIQTETTAKVKEFGDKQLDISQLYIATLVNAEELEDSKPVEVENEMEGVVYHIKLSPGAEILN